MMPDRDKILVKILERKRYYLMSLSWVLLLCFFTYTALIVSFFVKAGSFSGVYFSNQSQVVSMIVNVGLLVMVVFDYMSSDDQLPINNVMILLVGILFAMCIYGHSYLFSNHLETKYIAPISWNGLSFVSHVMFLLVLCYLKGELLYKAAKQQSLVAVPIH